MLRFHRKLTILAAALALCAAYEAAAQITVTRRQRTFPNGLTAQGVNPDGIANSNILLNGTTNYLGTSTFVGVRDITLYNMTGTGTPNVDSFQINSHLTGTANIGNYEGVLANLNIDSGYSGSPPSVAMFEANLFTNASTVLAQGYRGFLDDTKNPDNGLASGTSNDYEFDAEGLTGGSNGGTVNNVGVNVVVPSGGAVTGTTNNSGIHISGNGGTNAGGTTINWAILSTSAAGEGFAGGMVLGTPGGTNEGAGTVNANTGYYINAVAGVTCSGSPTASFASVKGIVTHC